MKLIPFAVILAVAKFCPTPGRSNDFTGLDGYYILIINGTNQFNVHAAYNLDGKHLGSEIPVIHDGLPMSKKRGRKRTRTNANPETPNVEDENILNDGAKLPVIYTDETWFDIYSRQSYGWVPRCAKTVQERKDFTFLKHKASRGPRIIIMHAGGENGFVDGMMDVYAVSKKDAAGDYHDNINNESYMKWFQRLMKTLEGLGPHIIVIDNAPYHSVTRKHGHKVLRTPPYNCQLNPIELVWSDVKRLLREQNTDQNLEANIIRAKNILQTYTADSWKRHVGHVKKLEQLYWDGDLQFELAMDRNAEMELAAIACDGDNIEILNTDPEDCADSQEEAGPSKLPRRRE
ncbi:unnamed protein product [Allacma fusca]|uniref:Tc1-like transposase DDE domain-containing protein n=1 Tax=Allacma fusca TaxID=39272 RepID=A0A8J2NS91_9HEXA|nr:unnamed protein product [Allacma fusca]